MTVLPNYGRPLEARPTMKLKTMLKFKERVALMNLLKLRSAFTPLLSVQQPDILQLPLIRGDIKTGPN